MNSSQPFKIVLVGNTGAGKSHLANRIAGEEYFDVNHSLISKETGIKQKTFEQTAFGRAMTIIDSQGFADNREASFENTLYAPIKLLNKLKSGFNAILFCEPARDRFDQSTIDNWKKIEALFKQEVRTHILVVITQLDKFQNYPKDRERIISRYKEDLPVLLKKHSIALPRENILFVDYTNFEAFKESFENRVKSLEFLQVQVKEINFENSLETLRHPIFREYLQYLKRSYSKKLDELEYKTDTERDQLECQCLIIQILQEGSLLQTELISSRLAELKSEVLSKFGNYFICEDYHQPSTLIHDISKGLWNVSYKKRKSLIGIIQESLCSILGQEQKSSLNLSEKIDKINFDISKTWTQRLVPFIGFVALPILCGAGLTALDSLAFSPSLSKLIPISALFFSCKVFSELYSRKKRVTQEIYKQIIQLPEINLLVRRILSEYFKQTVDLKIDGEMIQKL